MPGGKSSTIPLLCDWRKEASSSNYNIIVQLRHDIDNAIAYIYAQADQHAYIWIPRIWL